MKTLKSIRITSGPNPQGWLFLIIIAALCFTYKSLVPLLALLGYIAISLLIYFIVKPLLIKLDNHETEKFRRRMKEQWNCTDEEVDAIIAKWTVL